MHSSKSLEKTQSVANDLAKYISKQELPIVLALNGNLGSGKTTFTKYLAKALGVKEEVLSPSFVIFNRYDNFYHFDCYRIKNSSEILELGFDDILKGKNIIAIEWAEIIKDILPENTIYIDFKFVDETTREIKICHKKHLL